MKNNLIPRDFSLETIQATIDYMEETIPHDELPTVYDAWVAARDERRLNGEGTAKDA